MGGRGRMTPFGVPSHCPVCDRPVPDAPEPCSAQCEWRVDEWRDEPGDVEAQASEWLTVVDEEAA